MCTVELPCAAKRTDAAGLQTMMFGKESKEEKRAFLDPLRQLPIIMVCRSTRAVTCPGLSSLDSTACS